MPAEPRQNHTARIWTKSVYSATYSERDWVQMQAIAERLRATEGRHPLDLCDSLKAVQNSASNDDGGAQ